MEDSLKRSIGLIAKECRDDAFSINYDLNEATFRAAKADLDDKDAMFVLQLVCEAHAAMRLAKRIVTEKNTGK